MIDTNGNAFTLAGLVSGTGSLDVIGAGTLTLTANETYTGGTTITGATLSIGNGGSTGWITGNVVDNGSLVFNYTSFSNYDFTGQISGTGSLTVAGEVPYLFLTGANTYSGGTTIAGGTLFLGNARTNGSIVGNVVDDGALIFDTSSTETFAGSISGSGRVDIEDGTATLSGASSYTGGTRVLFTGSTLIVANASALGTGLVTLGGGTLALDLPSATLANALLVNPGSTVEANMPGSIVTLSSGTTITNTGLIEANGGTLVVDDASVGAGSFAATGTAQTLEHYQRDDGPGQLPHQRGSACCWTSQISVQQSVSFSGVDAARWRFRRPPIVVRFPALAMPIRSISRRSSTMHRITPYGFKTAVAAPWRSRIRQQAITWLPASA